MPYPDQKHGRADEVRERRARRSLLALAAVFAALVLSTVANVLLPGAGFAALSLILVAAVAIIGYVHLRLIAERDASRELESENLQRIFRRLSRSLSPDAIVDAIVEEIGVATGADHTVVVRLRTEARVLEATMVSSRAGVPSSTTLFPLSDLDDHGARPRTSSPREPVAAAAGGGEAGGSQRQARAGVAGLLGAARARADLGGPAPEVDASRIAEQLATRVRSVYGLKSTLAEALVTNRGPVGAIVLSRRTGERWAPAAERLLHAAAEEASAALARADSLRDAEERASTDPLTGLPNRRYFDEFCGLLSRRRRAADALGVAMIDIDHFKLLNDRYGHHVGDQVLYAVAQAIARAVREGDVPARYGGEEFIVLLRNPGPAVAVEVGERIRNAVRELDLSEIGTEGVTVSVGVAVSRLPDQPVTELVADADRALYQAKTAGRDRVFSID